MCEWLGVVTNYIRALEEGLDRTNQAGERGLYEGHLARAARLVAILASDGDDEQLSAWISEEEHGYGWSFLSGDEGDAAEIAFSTLMEWIRQRRQS